MKNFCKTMRFPRVHCLPAVTMVLLCGGKYRTNPNCFESADFRCTSPKCQIKAVWYIFDKRTKTKEFYLLEIEKDAWGSQRIRRWSFYFSPSTKMTLFWSTKRKTTKHNALSMFKIIRLQFWKPLFHGATNPTVSQVFNMKC